MSIPIVRPYIFLRCKKCSDKTTHVMISVKTNPESQDEKEEICECQECGELKKIIELTLGSFPPKKFQTTTENPSETPTKIINNDDNGNSKMKKWSRLYKREKESKEASLTS